MPLRVVQIGLGPLGQMLTPFLLERKSIQLIAAVDVDQNKIGKDLGDVGHLGHKLDILVTDNLDLALHQADCAIITTVSEFLRIAPLLQTVMAKKVHIVSTCEELSFPWKTHPELAAQIDREAKKNGVAVLGTGINPGFLMDFLPTAVTGVCRHVESILIERIQDASFRRLPFRQKIGAGLSVAEFQTLVEKKKIRHVGLTESMHMVASRLGWDLDKTEDIVEPIVAQDDIQGNGWAVAKGFATGVCQTGRGFVGNKQVLTLNFRAAVGQKDPQEHIHITGTPEFDVVIPGGINGDVATCSVVTNALSIITQVFAGLHTMVDIPPLSYAP